MNKAIDLEGSICISFWGIPTTKHAYHVLGKGKNRVASVYMSR
jgi:hypothetical protein